MNLNPPSYADLFPDLLLSGLENGSREYQNGYGVKGITRLTPEQREACDRVVRIEPMALELSNFVAADINHYWDELCAVLTSTQILRPFVMEFDSLS